MTHTLVGVGLSLSSWEGVDAVPDVSRLGCSSTTSGSGSATSVSSSSAVRLGKTTGCSSDPPTMGCPPLSASKIIMAANELATASQCSDGDGVNGGRPRAKYFYHGHNFSSGLYRYPHCRAKVPAGCDRRMNSWIALRVFTQYDFTSLNTLSCESGVRLEVESPPQVRCRN